MSSIQFTEYIMYSVHQWRDEVDFDAHEVSNHTRYHKSSRFLINVPSWMNINKYNFFTFSLLPQEGFAELKKTADSRANIGGTIIGAPIVGQ